MPSSIKAVVDAYEAGQTCYKVFRKVPTQTTASGIWFDLSMSPGAPVAQYYVGVAGTSTKLARSTDLGLDHGPDPAGYTKYLHKMLAMTQTATAVPLPLILCDYLMHYPFLAMDVGEFGLTNSISIPRYTTGAGVQMMAVEVFPQATGGAQFFLNYTNSAGVAGRISQTVTCNTQVATGTIITSAPATAGTAGPFIPLQDGDTGVRSVESIEFLSGDVGVIALVLVKPLASHSIYDITAPAEADFIIDRSLCPEIKPDAFLGLLAHPVGTLASAPIIGELHYFWS